MLVLPWRPRTITLLLGYVVLITLAFGVLLSLSGCNDPSGAQHDPRGVAHSPPDTHYAGWAMEAYPGDSIAHLEGEMRRQVRAGANLVWLGHDNPGEVGSGKLEPGLAYAVWAAYRDRSDPQHGAAEAMVMAVRRALEAARVIGVPVVLPVGYQIQMGQTWNAAHPQDLRRGADGSIYGNGGASASFYAPDYRRDILTYYRWVDRTFVRPYRSVILMLNLADEPEDGDYSSWADRAFRAQEGYGLFGAGNDPERQEAVGRFESNYIANYAAWSAGQWLRIDPTMPVTMSFCGGYSRYRHEGPNLEQIFRGAPSNFAVTFDAYPRDGPFDGAMREGDLISLVHLVRTLGYYSSIYHRPLWLWPAANSWGLNGGSHDPGGIADAVANGIYLALLARGTGGDLRGIAVWNYNVRDQGLYNDTHRLTYSPNRMFARVSASFPLLRRIMAAPSGSPDTVILAPDAPILQAAGATLPMRAADPYPWDALAAPARENVAAVTLTHLGSTLPASIHTAIVLARSPGDLTPGDRTVLGTLLHHGGAVVAGAAVAQGLAPDAGPSRTMVATAGVQVAAQSVIGHGLLLSVTGSPVEDLFADTAAPWAAPVWRQVFGRPIPASGYVIGARGVTLFYSGARSGATLKLPLRSSVPRLDLYDTQGAVLPRAHPSARTVHIARRSYGLMVSG